MCFRKSFVFFLNKDFQCRQILKLIAALSHAEPSPPPPHVPLIWITDRRHPTLLPLGLLTDNADLPALLLAAQEDACFGSFDSSVLGHRLLGLGELQSVLKTAKILCPILKNWLPWENKKKWWPFSSWFFLGNSPFSSVGKALTEYIEFQALCYMLVTQSSTANK